MSFSLSILADGIPLNPLPPQKTRNVNFPHAPNRSITALTSDEKKVSFFSQFFFVMYFTMYSVVLHHSFVFLQLAIKNALRYFPSKFHKELVDEFYDELMKYGHIYMYRFLPDLPIKAVPLNTLPAKCTQCAAIMLMILNNLDPEVAQFPHELVIYGGNGQIFSNWAQVCFLIRRGPNKMCIKLTHTLSKQLTT